MYIIILLGYRKTCFINRCDKHVIITYDEVPIENWYISGEQSREQRDFGIPSICMQHKEI